MIALFGISTTSLSQNKVQEKVYEYTESQVRKIDYLNKFRKEALEKDSTCQVRIAFLENQIASLDKEAESYTETRAEYENQIASLKRDREQLYDDIAKLNKEIEKLRRRIAAGKILIPVAFVGGVALGILIVL